MEWTYRKEVTFDTVSWKLLRQSLRGVCSQHGHEEPEDREDREALTSPAEREGGSVGLGRVARGQRPDQGHCPCVLTLLWGWRGDQGV